MSSVTRFAFAAPTPPPLGPYTPLSGLSTGANFVSQPRLLAAPGTVLQRIFSLTNTAASTFGFKWLSLGTGNSSQTGRPRLPATPTTRCCVEPTTTHIASSNLTPATIIIPSLVLLVSILFGAGFVHCCRPGESSRSLFMVDDDEARHEKPSPAKSSYSESPTIFYENEAVLPLSPDIPRHSYFKLRALNLVLRGLAFFFRLICLENLLDAVEGNPTERKAATSTVLWTLDKKVLEAINTVTPTGPRVSNEQSKPRKFFRPFPDDIILRPKDVKTPLSSTSRHRRSTSSPATVVAPFSVEPLGVPEKPLSTSSPTSKSSHELSLPIHLIADDCPSTPTRINAAVTPSVEPSGVPDRGTEALEPRAESIYQAKLRRISQRCMEGPTSSHRPRDSLPARDIGRPPSTSESDASAPPVCPPEIHTAHMREDMPPQTANRSTPSIHSSDEARDARLRLARERLATLAAKCSKPQPRKTAPQAASLNGIAKDVKLILSIDEVRERTRRTIERAREAANSLDTRIRTKRNDSESQQPADLPRRSSPKATDSVSQGRNVLSDLRKGREDLLASVHTTLRYRGKSRLEPSQDIESSQTVSVLEPLSKAGSVGEESLLSSEKPIWNDNSDTGGSWSMAYVPPASDDEAESDDNLVEIPTLEPPIRMKSQQVKLY